MSAIGDNPFSNEGTRKYEKTETRTDIRKPFWNQEVKTIQTTAPIYTNIDYRSNFRMTTPNIAPNASSDPIHQTITIQTQALAQLDKKHRDAVSEAINTKAQLIDLQKKTKLAEEQNTAKLNDLQKKLELAESEKTNTCAKLHALEKHLDQVYATIAAVASFAVIAFSMLKK